MSAGRELLPKWRTLKDGPVGRESQWFGWNETDTHAPIVSGEVQLGEKGWVAITEGWDGPSHKVISPHKTRKEAREAVVARLLAKDADR